MRANRQSHHRNGQPVRHVMLQKPRRNAPRGQNRAVPPAFGCATVVRAKLCFVLSSLEKAAGIAEYIRRAELCDISTKMKVCFQRCLEWNPRSTFRQIPPKKLPDWVPRRDERQERILVPVGDRCRLRVRDKATWVDTHLRQRQ